VFAQVFLYAGFFQNAVFAVMLRRIFPAGYSRIMCGGELLRLPLFEFTTKLSAHQDPVLSLQSAAKTLFRTTSAEAEANRQP
jgi:hypothetical protein